MFNYLSRIFDFIIFNLLNLKKLKKNLQNVKAYYQVHFYVRVQQWWFLACGGMLEMKTPTPVLAHGWMVNTRGFSHLFATHGFGLQWKVCQLQTEAPHHTQEKPPGSYKGIRKQNWLFSLVPVINCLKNAYQTTAQCRLQTLR